MRSSFFNCCTQAIDVQDIAGAKQFLIKTCGLTSEEAQQELSELQNLEAVLLCQFYEQGLRGTDLRELNHSVADEILSKIFCGDNHQVDRSFLEKLNIEMKRYNISVVDKLFLFILASRHEQKDKTKTREELREIGFNAFGILAGMKECHNMMIFVALLKNEDLEPQQALEKLHSDDPQVLEMRLIESPATRLHC